MVKNLFSGTTYRYHCFYSIKSGPYLLEITKNSLRFFAMFLIPQVTELLIFLRWCLKPTSFVLDRWSVDKAVRVSPDRALILTPFSKCFYSLSHLFYQKSIQLLKQQYHANNSDSWLPCSEELCTLKSKVKSHIKPICKSALLVLLHVGNRTATNKGLLLHTRSSRQSIRRNRI